MSAISLFTRDRVAYILADTGGYERDGRIACFLTKVAVSNRLGMAVAFNGAATEETTGVIEAWLSQVESQAEMLANMHLLANCLHQINVRDIEPGSDLAPWVQLFIAAWIDGAPTTYVLGSADNTFGEGYTAGTLIQVSSVTSPPVPDRLLPIHGFEPVKHGQNILSHQRTQTCPLGDHRVGGWGELVSVDAHAVRKRRIIEWPDVVGQRIADPLAPGKRLAA